MREITDFIVAQGLSEQSFYLLLTLPLVATIIGFGRHIIGIRTIGIYMPLSVTYAFYLFGTDGGSSNNILMGIRIGALFVFGIYIATTISHLITKRFRLHYLPKIGVVITVVTVISLFVLTGASYLGLIDLKNINALAIILLIIASEQFLGIFVKKNLAAATMYGFETLLLAMISYLLISIPQLRNLLINYPLVLLIAIPLNFAIGKFVGLRLNEYFRFSDILNEDESTNDTEE